MSETQSIHVFGGGTFMHVRNHLALAVPAFGKTARLITQTLRENFPLDVHLHLTKMADPTSDMVTNEDVKSTLDGLLGNRNTRVIVFNVALCDFNGHIGNISSGKYAKRIQSRSGPINMYMTPAEKLITRIKAVRPNIFVVGFKTTTHATSTEQYQRAETMIKESGADMVLANDTITRNNLIAMPNSDSHFESTDRFAAIERLCDSIRWQVGK